MILDFLATQGLGPLPAFAASLGLGLLIGLERERNPASNAGLRTFALVAMLGTLAGLIAEKTGSTWIVAAGLILVGLMMIAVNRRGNAATSDPGTTTVAAICVCYGLGVLIWLGFGTLAVMLGVITTTLLYFKPELQDMSQSLNRRDLFSILQFAVLSFVILPVLPNQDFGPYGALNPYQIWLMVVLVCGISLAGYIALRVAGKRHGVLLLGLLGGLVSSTATSLIYARKVRAQGMLPVAVVVILTANVVLPARLAVVGAAVAPGILPLLLPVLGCALLFGGIGTFFWWRKLVRQSELVLPEIRNPTEIRAAMGFGLVYAVVLVLSQWISDIAGSSGQYGVALLSGLTDMDAITLSTLQLYNQGKLQGLQAVAAIVLALTSNMIFKLGLVFVVGGAAPARRCALPMLAMISGAALALVLVARH